VTPGEAARAEFRRQQRYWRERAAIARRGRYVVKHGFGRSEVKGRKIRASSQNKDVAQRKKRARNRLRTKLKRLQRQRLMRR
jgi:hypothetical protein